MYLSLQIPKENDLEYGLYEVDGFLTCYTGKDGQVKPKFVVTNAIPTTKYEKKQEAKQEVKEEPTQENDPFAEFGEQITIDDNFLE